MDGVSYFHHHVSSFLCEIVYSNKRPADSEVITAKDLCLSDVTLDEKEIFLLFSCLLIAASLFLVFPRKNLQNV